MDTPQGSKLGQALLNLFINNLLCTHPVGSVVNFVDDNTTEPHGLMKHNSSNSSKVVHLEWHAVESSLSSLVELFHV